jgi:hypothetical protein
MSSLPCRVDERRVERNGRAGLFDDGRGLEGIVRIDRPGRQRDDGEQDE